MPSKKKKYNARFPAGRIKKIMQSDEEIGKVAQAVPVIISRTLELFVESLLAKTLKITNSRNARTLSTSHMKQCIMAENRFDFLRELVKNIPDISVAEEAANYNEDDVRSSPEPDQYPDNDTPYDLSMPSTSTQASRASSTLSNGYDSNTSLRSHKSRNGRGVAAVVGSHTMDLRGHSDERSLGHLKRELGGSLIMRSVDGVPSKLSRTDSTSLRSDAPAVYCPRQRLKHQSQSVPGNSNATITSNNNNNNKITSSKQKIGVLKEGSPQPSVHRQHTAINAPIVSYDFSNKPVVKIDYSILSADAKEAPVAPLSAPAEIGLSSGSKQHASAFHFSADPVISIDLSNIVADAAMKVAAATTPAAMAPTVNVTIGASPAIAMPKYQPTSSSTTHPKASLAAPLRSNSCSSSSGSSTGVPTSKNNNFFFELDEDYDNI